jgi:hypothetical protein
LRTIVTIRRVLGASLALGTLLSIPACSSEERGRLTREEYIEVFVEILLTAEESRDSVAATYATLAILERRGLTEEDLIEFANRYVDDAQALADIWAEIEERLRAPVEPQEPEEDPGGEESPEESGN